MQKCIDIALSLSLVIAATTFGVTMSLTANIRHKEDALNHAIGGYAAGTMIGAWCMWFFCFLFFYFSLGLIGLSVILSCQLFLTEVCLLIEEEPQIIKSHNSFNQSNAAHIYLFMSFQILSVNIADFSSSNNDVPEQSFLMIQLQLNKYKRNIFKIAHRAK